jgi:uncharacterized Fe-S cluster protein YjdI
MDEPTIRYTNGEITVLWKPNRCIHSGICVRGLPRVFDVKRRPWVDILAATTSEIRDQVDRCPSGALSWANVDSDD